MGRDDEAFLETERARAFTRAFRRSREWARSAPAGEIADKIKSLFPETAGSGLAAAIARYQELGCWEGDIGIPAERFDQASRCFVPAAPSRALHPIATSCASLRRRYPSGVRQGPIRRKNI